MCRRKMALPRSFLVTLLLLVSLTSAANAQSSEPINVLVGRTEIVRLSRPGAIVVIGDPTVADITYSRDVVFLTGKALGTTNFIALDADNKEILSSVVNVGAEIDVLADGEIQQYVCNPNCTQGNGSKEKTLSKLPAGSSVTVPVGGGKGL